MARTFDGNTANKLTRTDTLGLSAFPFTFACWAKPANLTDRHGLINFGLSSATNQYAFLWLDTFDDADHLTAGIVNPTVTRADSSNTFNVGEWNSCVATYAATAQAVWLNGTKTSSSFASRGFPTVDRTGVGILERSSSSLPTNGSIAWAAVWDVVLTDAEAEAFGKGAHPYTIRPGSLVAFWPLTGGGDAGEADALGTYPLTEAGTVGTAESPLVSLGWPINVTRTAAGGGGATIPIFAHHYNMLRAS